MSSESYPAYEGLQLVPPCPEGMQVPVYDAPEVVQRDLPKYAISASQHGSYKDQFAAREAEEDVVQIPASTPGGTILGLERKTFWIVLGIICVMIVAAAVVGGVLSKVLSKPTAGNIVTSAPIAISTAVVTVTATNNASSSSTALTTSSIESTTSSTLSTISSRLATTIASSTISLTSITSTPTTSSAAPSSTLCNGSADLCNINNCTGVNNPNGGYGKCTAGIYIGCACISVCGTDSIGYCDQNGCNAINNVCTAGDYNGCDCLSG